VSYCKFEGDRFRQQCRADPDLERIVALRERVTTRDWQKVPVSMQADHLPPLVGDEDIPIGISERISLFLSRTFASDAVRTKYTALLRPEVEAGRISTQDYDLCITALANKVDMFAILSHCAASLGTLCSVSVFLLAFPRTRPIARKLPFARMFGPTIIVACGAVYHDARMPTEFRDRRDVIQVLEKVTRLP